MGLLVLVRSYPVRVAEDVVCGGCLLAEPKKRGWSRSVCWGSWRQNEQVHRGCPCVLDASLSQSGTAVLVQLLFLAFGRCQR